MAVKKTHIDIKNVRGTDGKIMAMLNTDNLTYANCKRIYVKKLR